MSSSVLPTPKVFLRLAFATAGLAVLAGCEEGQGPGFLNAKPSSSSESAGASGGSAVSERDVEAPDVFQTTEAGLWDGRPSLGGVWVAHPDVKDPERVIVRNENNGKFVIGALFRRERETPGPRLQLSSEAAAALGVLAGQPTNLDVVALRREEVFVDAPPAPQAPSENADTLPDAGEVTETTLAPSDNAQAAPAPAAAPASPPASAPKPKPAPKPAAKSSSLSKPFIQLGIFSVEQNAKNTATAMRQKGLLPTIKPLKSNGKTFYRVVVGPAQTKSELTQIQKTVKASGFADAYAVSR
ncbi:MAG: SPOR domain-containing protein [Pelagimonas sp.]|jgi:cell division septation protein DedD|nr:SPOR domain-containing protein [Pelagimonas sp.]